MNLKLEITVDSGFDHAKYGAACMIASC